MSTVHVLAGIAWDPQIRGILATAVGVVVLLGSVYLLLLTNVGSRLGFLVASAAFWGWMFIMGAVWWLYGTVGMLGDLPAWEIKEIVYPGVEQADLEEAHALDPESIPLPPSDEFFDLDPAEQQDRSEQVAPAIGGWTVLLESNPQFGEAKAVVDEHFVEHPDEELGLEGPEDYITDYTFERGGKELLPDDPSRWDRIEKFFRSTFWELRHPPHYAVMQLRPTIEQTPVPGEPPPAPVADESAPVVSVIMERNLGDRRFPGAMLTISSLIMFGVSCMALHRRDLRVAEARGIDTGVV